MLRIYPVMLGTLARLRPVVAEIERRDPDLARQMRRAASSAVLNVAEGMYSRGKNRGARYHTALGSMRETLACIEVAGALAYCVRPGLFLGGEARYARTYDGLALDRFAGEAVYLGPTAYTTLSPQAWASFTWSFQVAGQATGEPGPLDLSSFDRHQMRLRVGYNF